MYRREESKKWSYKLSNIPKSELLGIYMVPLQQRLLDALACDVEHAELQYSVIMTILPRITCANLRKSSRPSASVTAIGFKGQRNNNRGGEGLVSRLGLRNCDRVQRST